MYNMGEYLRVCIVLKTESKENEPLKAQNVINKTGKLHEQCHNSENA
jgi:hypothetical protein